jgi:hypothetical protein
MFFSAYFAYLLQSNRLWSFHLGPDLLLPALRHTNQTVAGFDAAGLRVLNRFFLFIHRHGKK